MSANNDVTKRIGRIILAERKKKGWTRAQLAEKSGLSNQTISNLETGLKPNCKIKTLINLIETLNLRADYVLGTSIYPLDLENEIQTLSNEQKDLIISIMRSLKEYERKK